MPPLLQIVTFVTITLATGALFHNYNLNAFLGIFLGASIQFVFSYIYNSALAAYLSLKNKALENERIKEFSFQGIEVECPCFKKIKEFVPVKLNSDNRYKCSECQKTVSVLIEATTAVATQPIYNTEITSDSLPELKEV